MFKGHSCCQCDHQNLFLVLHGTWFYQVVMGGGDVNGLQNGTYIYFVRSL